MVRWWKGVMAKVMAMEVVRLRAETARLMY
jgi:hypothetical protein